MKRWIIRSLITVVVIAVAVPAALLLWSGQQSAQIVQSGDQAAAQASLSCSYVTNLSDGSIVLVKENGSACATAESKLATFGNTVWRSGSLGNGQWTAECTLSAGDSTMTVYLSDSSPGQPDADPLGIAEQICSANEQGGWQSS